MKQVIKDYLATVSMVILLLAVVATFYKGHLLYISAVFQIFAVTLLIHIGLKLLSKFESQYFLVEILLEVSMILVILLIAGYICDWYKSISVGVLVMMGIVVYGIGGFIGVFKVQEDVNWINEALSRKKEESKHH